MNQSEEVICPDLAKLKYDQTSEADCDSMDSLISSSSNGVQTKSKMSVEEYEKSTFCKKYSSSKTQIKAGGEEVAKKEKRVYISVQCVDRSSQSLTEEDPFEQDEAEQKPSKTCRLIPRSLDDGQGGSKNVEFLEIAEQSNESDSWHAQSVNPSQSHNRSFEDYELNGKSEESKSNSSFEIDNDRSPQSARDQSFSKDGEVASPSSRNSGQRQSLVEENYRRIPARVKSQSLGELVRNLNHGPLEQLRDEVQAENEQGYQQDDLSSEQQSLSEAIEEGDESEDTDCDDAHCDEIQDDLARRTKIGKKSFIDFNAASRDLLTSQKLR